MNFCRKLAQKVERPELKERDCQDDISVDEKVE